MTLSTDLDRVLDLVLKLEGGYQNSPNDSGNWFRGELMGTNFGITPKTYFALTNEIPTEAKMKALSPAKAKELLKYYAFYVQRIPDDLLAVNVFDMCVNAGPHRACVLVQRLAGVREDGIIGAKTAQAIQDVPVTTDDYVEARIAYYNRVVDHNAKNAKFLKGWINRANKFKTESLKRLLSQI
jgi:lysozyme family protein